MIPNFIEILTWTDFTEVFLWESLNRQSLISFSNLRYLNDHTLILLLQIYATLPTPSHCKLILKVYANKIVSLKLALRFVQSIDAMANLLTFYKGFFDQ